jgi:MFS family permease
LVFQPLVAYILVKFPIGKFLAVMVFAWGAILCGMTAAHNFTGLLISRLVLGIFESAVGTFVSPECSKHQDYGKLTLNLSSPAPTFVAVVQMWYRRREQTKRNAAWYAMLGVVNIVSLHPPSSPSRPCGLY